jgi:pSer/pThr/pTyr-binding forkhead associated (FHA) protein
MPKVYVKFNSAVIKEINLAKDEITFGRKPTNDIVIDHPTISGFHGKIRKDGDKYVVEDLNSTNGLFLNGHRIKNGQVKNKDQIGVAGHILEFISDASAETAAPESPVTAEVERQKELLRRSLGIGADGKALPRTAEPVKEDRPAEASEPTGGPAVAAPAVIRIISGGVNGQSEVKLKDLVTYIGSSDQAAIKIKGFLAPSLAAAISRRPEGYFLKAVKAGYPKVNGNAVNEQIFLEHGALIEVGGTNMVFYRTDKKASSESAEA